MTNKKRIILTIILISYFMILLDNSIIFTGTVKIAEELKLTPILLSWVNNAYALTFGGLLLVGGRLGDIFNRKAIFSIGLIIFGLGSLAVSISINGTGIIVSRAFQGIGSAILAPTTLSLLIQNFKGEEKTSAISAYGATAGIGASLGLVIGGLFASLMSWRDGFLINVPIAIMMLIVTFIYIPSSKQNNESGLDFGGAISSFFLMLTLIYSIVGTELKWFSIIMLIIFVIVFFYQESHTKSPLVPLHLFKNKERLGAYIARFLYMGGMLSMWFLTPQILQTQLQFTPLQAGIAFFPLTIVNFIVALAVSNLTKRFGNANLLITGITITLAGTIGLWWFTPELGYFLGIALPMALMGFGQGLTLSPLTSASISHVETQDSGAASGLVNVFHQIGGSFGVSIVSALSEKSLGSLNSYHMSMIITAIFIALSLIIIALVVYPNTKKF